MYYHDLEAMSSNPGQVKLGVRIRNKISKSYLNKKNKKYCYVLLQLSLCITILKHTQQLHMHTRAEG